jgi:hypothetical protein
LLRQPPAPKTTQCDEKNHSNVRWPIAGLGHIVFIEGIPDGWKEKSEHHEAVLVTLGAVSGLRG